MTVVGTHFDTDRLLFFRIYVCLFFVNISIVNLTACGLNI